MPGTARPDPVDLARQQDQRMRRSEELPKVSVKELHRVSGAGPGAASNPPGFTRYEASARGYPAKYACTLPVVRAPRIQAENGIP